MQDFKKITRKVCKNAVFFLILFLILMGLSNQMIQASMEDDSAVQSRNKSIVQIQKERPNSIDVLVLGDSLSYSAISPMELWKQYGVSSYVCGQSGQRIQETYYLLKTALETQTPKLVIIETNAMFRGQPGLAGVKELIEEWGNEHISIFRYHDMWKSYLIKRNVPKEYKGFAFRCAVQPYTKGEYMVKTEEKKEMPVMVQEYMEKIIQLCKQKNIPILLLSTPSPANYSYKQHNTLKAYAEEHQLDYLNLNLKLQEIGIKWEKDSLDQGDHLNFRGARKVTRYLGRYLNSSYMLADHRDDPLFVSWKQLAKEYKKDFRYSLKVVKKNEDRNNRKMEKENNSGFSGSLSGIVRGTV